MRSKSRKPSNLKNDVALHLERTCKVLRVLLATNCQEYEWCDHVLGIIRARDYPLLYSWAESASTAVCSTARETFAKAQLAAMVKKAPIPHSVFGFTVSPEEVARQKFLDAERRCEISNRRFSSGRWRSSRYSRYIFAMQEWIRRVIGDEPPLEQIYDFCGFSGGSARGVHGSRTNLYRKFFADVWTCTPTAVPYARSALKRNASFNLSLFPEREGVKCFDEEAWDTFFTDKVAHTVANTVSFVPKTAKTHRAIAVEPLLNSFIQSGVDESLRLMLRRHGYDLRSQERNQNLAMDGSIDGRYSTFDLSSASDTVSLAVVKELLPRSWFCLLDATRSPAYQLSGTSQPERYHKFVSMGNGFCFPLETLVFAAAVNAVKQLHGVAGSDAVYGDDIIVPKAAGTHLSKLLLFLGFIPNMDKTFVSGPFRESCGADWYEGLDIRPVYVDHLLVETSDLMVFHNATLRSERCKIFFQEVRPLIRSWVPSSKRLLRPVQPPVRRVISLLELRNLNGAFTVEADEFMGSKWSRWVRHEQRWGWSEFLFTPKADFCRSPYFNLAQYWALLLGSPKGELHLRYTARRTVTHR